MYPIATCVSYGGSCERKRRGYSRGTFHYDLGGANLSTYTTGSTNQEIKFRVISDSPI